jgi:RHS repeat-associated protein
MGVATGGWIAGRLGRECRVSLAGYAVARLRGRSECSDSELRSCLSRLRGAMILVVLAASMFGLLANASTAAAVEPSCHIEGRLYWDSESLKGGEPLYFTEYEVGESPHVESEHRVSLSLRRDHYAICTRNGHVVRPVAECTSYGEAKCEENWRGQAPGTHPFFNNVWIAVNLEFRYDLLEGGEYQPGNWNLCLHSCGEEIRFWELLGNRLRKHGRRRRERLGEHNPADPNLSEPCEGDPVDCATGNLTESQTDLSVGGRGVPLALTRTYNSQATIEEGSAGMFGFGWSSSFSDHLEINKTLKMVTVVQANGSTVVFEGNPETVGELKSPRWAQAKLSRQSNGTFLYTLPNQATFTFNGEGRLSSEADRNGNTTSLTYNTSNQLETVTDSSGRKFALTYNSGGQAESVTDPMGHTVKYGHEGGDLTSVTEPGESSPRWRFKYESHRMTEMTGGPSDTTKNEFGSNRVVKQTDPMGHVTRFAYEQAPGGEFSEGASSVAEETIEDEREPEMSSETEENEYLTQVKANGGTVPSPPEFVTKITNEATGEVTQEHFNNEDQLISVTRGYGTSNATTQSFSYDTAGNTLSVTDGNGHKTRYEYDGAGNRTKMIDANEHETKWTYNSTHDVETITTPKGETTTIKRDSHGNAESVSRPAPKEATQTTKYTYDYHGDVESMTDPLGRVWKYEYDSYGDRTTEIDPETDKRTWAYNQDSQEVSTVSPRGNVTGGEPAKYTTAIERDAQNRLLVVTEFAGSGKPSNRTQSTISGGAQEGQTLSAGVGIWEGAPPLTYTYQWQHCNAFGGSCSSISGATNSTYLLTKGDLGDTLRVVATATNSMGSASSTSGATAVVSESSAVSVVYSSQFGSKGSGNGQFQEPEGVVSNSNGNLWIADRFNSRVEELSSTGAYITKFGSEGTGNGQFKRPRDVAIDSHGNIWVADTKNNRVQEFSSTGEYIRQFGSEGTGNGQFKEPSGIAFAANGNVWVTDSLNDRVQEFTSTGEYVTKFGSEGTGSGQFTEPRGIAIASNGALWITDTRDNRVEEFTAPGEYITQVGTYGSGNAQFFGPTGIEVDSNSHIWVADTGNNRVQELSSAGAYIRQFGSEGTGNGQFKEPAGITVDPAGNVWVADTKNNRIQGLSATGEYITQFGTKGTGNGQFQEPEGVASDSNADLWIADRFNSRVEEWKAAVAPLNTTLPSISGQLLVGQTLAVSTGTWSAVPSPTYSYQWQHCNASGGSCSAISGATSSTYLLGTGDIGYTLQVVVTATNSAGSTESSSAATEILAHTTAYSYDANGNLESVIDPNGHKTKYTYNTDNQPIKVTEPNGTVTETGYDGAGRVTSQTDGNKHETKYVRNVLGEVTEVVDPLGRKTTKEYDNAGNLKTLTDPAKRTTTYTYDPANRLTEVGYSDGKTHAVKYEYDADGDRTSMVDGTGTTTYGYDQLDRLTESKDGHGDTTGYEYDLANEQTKITYPNGKAVTRTYDKAARLEKVTDWLEHTTKFAYDPNSNLTTTTFPAGTSNEDKYVYNEADQMSEAKMTKGTETLASLLYTRDNDGQVKKTVTKGLPGTEATEYAYDENNRLTKAGTTPYEYDAAYNQTKTGTSTNTYDNADELKTGTGLTYTYDELGERTKTTPTTGPATTYSYDEAGNLTSVERSKEGETAEIKDTYAYDSNSLRASQTISGTTSYLTWDMTEALPLILNDGTNNYIYGPSNQPIEQISSGGTVTYLHHDQAGSTRLLTGSTGTVEGAYTYDVYGNQTGHTGTATTPLGYDAQYTSSDTGLIYLRARVYDPATAQFMSVDPLGPITREPYSYGSDDPVNYGDPTGLIFGIPGTPSWEDIGTRFVGFWDGFTAPVFGGTAALRGSLGLNGGLDACSGEYKGATRWGSLAVSLEAGTIFGAAADIGVGALGGLRVGAIKLGPIIGPLAAGVAGGTAQTVVAGRKPSLTTVGQGAVGGLVGEFATGLVPGTSAPGVAGAVNTAFGFVW